MQRQIQFFKDNCPVKSVNNIVLVGSKADDLIGKREVSHDKASELVKRMELLSYYETSAKEGTNVDEVFFAVAFEAYNIEFPGGRATSTNRRSSKTGYLSDLAFDNESKGRKTSVLNVSDANLDASVISLRNS